MLTVNGMTVDAYGQTINEVGDTEDPFALMVDTAPELMTVGEIIRYAVPIGISRAEINTVAKVLLPSDYEDVDNVKQIVEEAVENLRNDGTDIEMDRLYLGDVLKQQQELGKRSKTNRFLVKYKDSGENSFREKVGDVIKESIDLYSSEEESTVQSLGDIESMDKLYQISPDTVDLVKWEKKDHWKLLVLEDRVNPSEFAKMLRKRNAADDIKYIQPDFPMELDSLEDPQPGEASETTSVDESITLTITEETEGGEAAATDSGISDEEAVSDELLEALQKNKVLVAVIDTGIDTTHPDLEEYIYSNPGEIPDNGVDDDGTNMIIRIRE